MGHALSDHVDQPLVYHLFLLPLTLIMCRVRVVGRERLHNVQGPALLISNHVTDVDAPLILSALPFRWRLRSPSPCKVNCCANGAQTRNFITHSAALFNVFPLPRQSGFRKSFAYGGEAVDRGFSVLIFPEGHETKDGLMQPFRGGIGLLASALNIPIIPIRLDGLFELKQRRQFFVRPNTVSLTFGQPLTFSPDHPPDQITRELERAVRDA